MKRVLYHFFSILLLTSFAITAQAAITLTNQITGINNPLLENVIARLEASQNMTRRTLTPKLIRQLYQQAPAQIQKALEPFGFFKSTITSKLSHKNDQWLAIYHIKKGPSLRVTHLTIKITGEGTQTLQKYLHRLPLKKGHRFNALKYKKIKTMLLNKAQKHGFLAAKLTRDQLQINVPQDTCDINIILNTGPQFYYGDITFDKTPLNMSFLRRFLNIHQNMIFSYEKLIDLQQALNASTYFQNVTVIPQHKKTLHKHIPVHVGIKMKRRKAYLFGAGYGTNTGLRGTIGFNQRWLNRFGHKFNATLKLSQIENSLDAQYIIPGKKPSHDQYAISAGYIRQRPKQGESVTKKLGLTRITNYQFWQRIMGLTYQLERYRIEDHGPYKGSKLLMPNVAFSRILAPSTMHVENGSRFNIHFNGASTNLLSTVTFLQTQLQYKLIHTFFKSHRIILRADLGYTVVHKLDKLPLSQRFYAGGIGSVRGYGLKSLGPGRFLAIGSAEYQKRIYGNWYAAAFYDIGNAMDHTNDPLERGVGGGIVWQSPIGALQVYVARAISKKDKPWSIQISLGPDL